MMADRFAKQPTNIRAGTSVKVDVTFDWFGGKNRDIELKGNYFPKMPFDFTSDPKMKQYAKDFWAKQTKEIT
jgi:hypothetical protein